MSWGMIGSAAVSVVGGAILSKGKTSQSSATSSYNADTSELSNKSAEVEQTQREAAGGAWGKFGEGAEKGQTYYDAVGDVGKDQLSIWRTEGLPILRDLGLHKIDATDRTAEQEGLAANAVKTQYGQGRETARRALEFARNPGDPGYGDILGATYGREAADVAQAITNARLAERERLQGVEEANYAREKGLYDIYGNLLTQGVNTTGAAGAGTQRTSALYSGQASKLEDSANSAAARQTTLAAQRYGANADAARANAASAEKLGGAVGGIAGNLINKWTSSVDPTGGGGPGPVDPNYVGPFNAGSSGVGNFSEMPAQVGGLAGTGLGEWSMMPAGGFRGGGAIRRRYAEGGEVEETGGKIEGPGTGTSDSVSAIKRPGTYILSADTVRALGHKKLEDLMEKAGVRKSFKGGGGEESDDKGEAVRLSSGEWAMPPEVTKYHGEEFFNKLQQKFHRPVFAEEGMANGGAIRKRRLPQAVEDAIYKGMPTRALGRRY